MSKSLPPGWRRVRLGEFVKERNGFVTVDDSKTYRRITVRLHNKGIELRDEISGLKIKTKKQKVVRTGDLVVAEIDAKVGGFGIATPWAEGAIVSSHYFLFTVDQSVCELGYLDACIRKGMLHKQVTAVGSTNYAAIRPGQVLDYRVPLPPLPEQKRIAAALRAVDEAINASQDVISSAVKLKKILAHELLTRGVPGRHTRFKDTTMGRIPADWNTSPVGQVGRVQLGRQRSPAHQTGEFTRPYLRVANVFDGYIKYTDVLEMDFDDKDFEMYCLYPGDILLNEGQSRELVGRPAIFDGPPRSYCFQNTLVRFRPADFVLTEFALAYFQMCLHKGIFARISRQTTSIAHLGAERFSRLPFPVPTLDEQREISITLNTSTESLRAQADSLDHLTEVRMDLAGALLSGSLGNLVVDDF